MKPVTLADFTSEYRHSGDELNYYQCPVCGTDGWKVYVNPTTGRWFCFALKHGAGGHVKVAADVDALRVMYQQRNAGLELVWPEVTLPEFQPLGQMARRYLARRGLTERQCHRLRLVEMTGKGYVIIPSIGWHGQIVHWTARQYVLLGSNGPRYLSAPVSKPPFIPGGWRPSARLVLVEGPFDAINVWRTTRLTAVCIGGTTASATMVQALKAMNPREMDIMLDGDATAKAITLKNHFTDQCAVTVHKLPMNEDPGSLDGRTLREMLCRRSDW